MRIDTRTTLLALIVVATLVAQVPTSAAAASQSKARTDQSSPESPWPPAGVFRFQPGGDVTAPRLIKSARPDYPADAMRAKIQGRVEMEAVIQPDGTIGQVRVKRSLDRKFGLDDAAVRSVKDYRFMPGMKDSVAVPVLLSMEVAFTLRK